MDPGIPQERISLEEVRRRAASNIHAAQVLPRRQHASALPSLIQQAEDDLTRLLERCRASVANRLGLPAAQEVVENARLFDSALADIRAASSFLIELPHVSGSNPFDKSVQQTNAEIPHILSLASDYLAAVDLDWSVETLQAYVGEIQTPEPLHLNEVLRLPQVLKFAILQFVLDAAWRATEGNTVVMTVHPERVSRGVRSLREISQIEWRSILESMIAFDEILRRDPAGIYEQMDVETRAIYRQHIALIASRSDMNETRVAMAALNLAREAAERSYRDPRVASRESHIGFYLISKGFDALARRAGYHPTLLERLRAIIRRYADEVYIGGIQVVTALLMVAVFAPLVPHHFEILGLFIAFLLTLLPASQAAVDLINKMITSVLDTAPLPKIDFQAGVPAHATTLVAVPTLLLNEQQVSGLIDGLETRYLNNVDPNIYFALLTDLPDSVSRPNVNDRNPLVDLARRRIEHLNQKYSNSRGGSFLLLHRQRAFNPKQGVWMGFERKRGKLLDLNQLLAGRYDSFPIKAGNVDALARVKFVITLDSDTQLPRETAHRLIGTMAHPLNRAIIDPVLRIVTEGYGILQPRVGVSIHSASLSRFASIYSGETGYDIYTRAVSDVYQDLYGEGIFTGKGIYEAEVLQAVLDRRFPRNSLLSHDLIEGAYARAGLVTDVEVIDDYPSHYSAHIRRNHRWVRGDWQITRWLLPRVIDEQGHRVHNPISTISAWKIFDNLRRSLIQPATFLLLFFGWLFLPGSPLYWTVVTLLFLALPSITEFALGVVRLILSRNVKEIPDVISDFISGLGFALLNLIFLPHHALLQADAIVRALVRTFVTGRRLLEWETAAEAESNDRRSAADQYLAWMPLLAVTAGAILAYVHLPRLIPAAPILALWAASPLVTNWLNGPKYARPRSMLRREVALLQQTALYTWRYFADFGGEANRYLIPDHVEEDRLYQDRKISPTNLGLLLNARQAALEFGFLTLPEFVQLTEECLGTYDNLSRYRGHPLNWYDIETLEPLRPQIVSAVDSGNLAASFYCLSSGILDLLSRPLLRDSLLTGLDICFQQSKVSYADVSWPAKAEMVFKRQHESHTPASETWQRKEGTRRITAAVNFLSEFAPWLLPENSSSLAENGPPENPKLLDAPEFVRSLAPRMIETDESNLKLRDALFKAGDRLQSLVERLHNLAARAERYADEMDFSFLMVQSRKLLSIGYEVETGKLYDSCYDLLASEARMAVYIAVAKNDIPQESWFRLDRTHTVVKGRPVLLSWTGTMFEYLMPALWMHNYPNALISRTLRAVPYIQRTHVNGTPWGISESGFAKRDPSGRYGYQAWGIPSLALKYDAQDGPVISPYSTFLALEVDQTNALRNIRRMHAAGWFSDYGFYEAADFIESRRKPALVRSWMAHHQGMVLLSITNRLQEQAFHRWFHLNPRLRATELLLHEKPLQGRSLAAITPRKTVAPNKD